MKTTLYLARHGQTQWNKAQRLQGQLDSDLTEQGRQQSEILARSIADKQVSIIVSSTLGRAKDTALICRDFLDIPVINHEGLIERDLGIWQGSYVHQINFDKNYLEVLHQFTALTAHEGESAIACGIRIHQTLTFIAKKYSKKNVLVIFHGEALRCFLAHLGHTSTENAYQLFNNGSVSHLTFDSQTNRFQLFDAVET